MIFLDANIFLRFLTRDDPEKAADCRDLILSLENENEAATSELVISEVVFVLSSKANYGYSRQAVVESVRPLLLLRGLRIAEKTRILRAFDFYESVPQLSFGDCLIAAYVENTPEIEALISYDRDFDRINGLARLEPRQVLSV